MADLASTLATLQNAQDWGKKRGDSDGSAFSVLQPLLSSSSEATLRLHVREAAVRSTRVMVKEDEG